MNGRPVLYKSIKGYTSSVCDEEDPYIGFNNSLDKLVNARQSLAISIQSKGCNLIPSQGIAYLLLGKQV